MIAASSLNQRIDIQSRTASVDAIGQPVESWSLVAAVWANVRFPSGSASIRGDADSSVTKASFRIRYRTGLTEGMRVVYVGKNYNIGAILPNRAEGYCDLVCEAY